MSPRSAATSSARTGFVIDQLTINGALRLPQNGPPTPINRAMEATQNAIQSEKPRPAGEGRGPSRRSRRRAGAAEAVREKAAGDGRRPPHSRAAPRRRRTRILRPVDEPRRPPVTARSSTGTVSSPATTAADRSPMLHDRRDQARDRARRDDAREAAARSARGGCARVPLATRLPRRRPPPSPRRHPPSPHRTGADPSRCFRHLAPPGGMLGVASGAREPKVVVDLRVLAYVFGVIFVARAYPDKTAIAAVVLATRHKPLPVFVGSAIAPHAPERGRRPPRERCCPVTSARGPCRGRASCSSCRPVFMWRRREEKDGDDGKKKDDGRAGFFRSAWITFGVVFIAELGDLNPARDRGDGRPLQGAGGQCSLGAHRRALVRVGDRHLRPVTARPKFLKPEITPEGRRGPLRARRASRSSPGSSKGWTWLWGRGS